MDKPLKIVIWILLGVIVVNLLFSFFSDSSLRAIRRDLQKANRTADSALHELRVAKDRVDSIKIDIVIFRSYIDNIQKNVEASDLEMRMKSEKDAAKLKEMKERLADLRKQVENDSLPEIDERTP
jgi:chromosome segregation ATPase